jgi:ubiquinol-cytochrome c reductase cytochrome b subunit
MGPDERAPVDQSGQRDAQRQNEHVARGWLGRTYGWVDDRLGISAAIMPVVTHPVPKHLGWSYVLGSMTMVAFVVQVVTGVALAFSYVPSTDAAYESLHFITSEALLGRVLRGMHYFGATAMVICVFAHLVQVFLIAAYKYPRELNWISGSVLLLLTLALSFTGQLLRWEQTAYWSIVIAAEQIGRVPVVGGVLMQLVLAGWTIGPATLTRFYATHVFLLPALVFLFLGMHLYLVIRQGISEYPRPGRRVDPKTYPAYYESLLEQGEPFFPDSYWRDVVAAMALVAAIVGLAVWLGPPALGEPPDPTLIQAYPRPDWYFLWYFALLALIPPASETLVILGFPLAVGVVLILMPFLAPYGERAPSRRPWAVASVVLMFTAFLGLSWAGYESRWSPVLVGWNQIPYPAEVTASLTPSQQRGAQLFQDRGCHACHAIGGQGGRVGPDLSNVGSTGQPDYVVTTILRGRGNMPAFADTLSADELGALVDFLGTLRQPSGSR